MLEAKLADFRLETTVQNTTAGEEEHVGSQVSSSPPTNNACNEENDICSPLAPSRGVTIGRSGSAVRRSLPKHPPASQPRSGYVLRGPSTSRQRVVRGRESREQLLTDVGLRRGGQRMRVLESLSLLVRCHDRLGLLADVTGLIRKFDLYIMTYAGTTDPRSLCGVMSFELKGRTAELARLCGEIEKVDGVMSFSCFSSLSDAPKRGDEQGDASDEAPAA